MAPGIRSAQGLFVFLLGLFAVLLLLLRTGELCGLGSLCPARAFKNPSGGSAWRDRPAQPFWTG